MKLIIAGSRTLVEPPLYLIDEALAEIHQLIYPRSLPITEVVSGLATGIDTLGLKWAQAHDIPTQTFPARWKLHGSAAGTIRNVQMARYADVLLAIWDTQSFGTLDMISQMRTLSKPTFVYKMNTTATSPWTLEAYFTHCLPKLPTQVSYEESNHA